ncbi:hypothetical protein [Rufibacter sp. LB8]|nr:hypothetical protein [Rufibacter sp. LB8]
MTLSALVIAATSFFSCTRDLAPTDVPSLALNSVKAKFPQALTIDWEKAGDLFEAEFEVNGLDQTILVDANGTISKVKQDLLVTDLPAAVDAAIKRDFAGYVVDDLEKVEINGQVYYQVELENKLKTVEKVFAADGTVATVAYWD